MFNLTAPVVALLTPFDSRGNIDWLAFKSYLSALSGWGVRSAIINGTTAEFPSLTLDERQKILEFVKNNFPGTLINNVSSTCVKDARKLIGGTREVGDAVLLLPPYYYAEAGQEGLCRFFTETLAATALPVFLYNFPKHTGNPIDSHLIKMLLDQGVEITGIKDSSGDLANAIDYQTHFPKLKIFYANDSEALKALEKDLAGSVTGGANPLPEFLLAIQEAFQEGAWNKAQAMQSAFNVWNDYRAGIGFFEIPLVKAAMGTRIKDFPCYVRAPLTPIPSRAISRVRTTVLERLSVLKAILENAP